MQKEGSLLSKIAKTSVPRQYLSFSAKKLKTGSLEAELRAWIKFIMKFQEKKEQTHDLLCFTLPVSKLGLESPRAEATKMSGMKTCSLMVT